MKITISAIHISLLSAALGLPSGPGNTGFLNPTAGNANIINSMLAYEYLSDYFGVPSNARYGLPTGNGDSAGLGGYSNLSNALSNIASSQPNSDTTTTPGTDLNNISGEDLVKLLGPGPDTNSTQESSVSKRGYVPMSRDWGVSGITLLGYMLKRDDPEAQKNVVEQLSKRGYVPMSRDWGVSGITLLGYMLKREDPASDSQLSKRGYVPMSRDWGVSGITLLGYMMKRGDSNQVSKRGYVPMSRDWGVSGITLLGYMLKRGLEEEAKDNKMNKRDSNNSDLLGSDLIGYFAKRGLESQVEDITHEGPQRPLIKGTELFNKMMLNELV
ncbi:hypothetical protein BB559_007385 [Furculomyces boomerangus]|uniref:Uncharacterized protein n=1 Tax=Furculomyces boomerangus TaxID=61424 RepID=A0A2T9XXJ7_9FUNG|nr:hypothetical protein BB559_007385 [Furculomyces boomerangus]